MTTCNRRQFVAGCTASLYSMARGGVSGAASGALSASTQGRTQQGGYVDVHHHILPPEYVRIVGRVAIGKPAPTGAPTWDVTTSLRFMDQRGIRTSMVSVSAPGIWFGDAVQAKKLARVSNEFAARMVADYPDRFGSLAALPLPDTRASVEELRHAVEVLKCDGICLITNYGNTYLGDSSFDPVLAEIDQLRLPVYVHPYACDCDQSVLPGVPLSMIEFPHSTTRAIVNMLSAGVFARFPNIPFVFSHAGGTLPFLANRVSRQGALLGESGWLETIKRLHYDTASSANGLAFGPLLQLVTTKQILLGTDFPFASSESAGATVSDVERLGLASDAIRDIREGNARRLFTRLAV